MKPVADILFKPRFRALIGLSALHRGILRAPARQLQGLSLVRALRSSAGDFCFWLWLLIFPNKKNELHAPF